MSHSIQLPRMMEIGKNSRSKLPDILGALGCKKPLIITDKVMVSLGYIAKIQEILNNAGIDSDFFDQTIPEPTSSSIEAGVEHVKTHQYDAIIAVGGGSPIDSAKAISILGKFGGNIRDYKFPRQVNETGLPIIAIPTTAGTGSECTRFTIITDDATSEKMLCAGIGFLPVAAIVDYELTMSLPARTTADTGIDALTHAIEAYVSKKASLYSDAQAKEDIEKVRDKVDVVMVSMHWGTEYTHTPTSEQRRQAAYLASLGVDVIIGHHPHVIQPIEFIDDTLVIYSLGNFLSAQDGVNKRVGMMAAFTINKTTTDGKLTDLNISDVKGDLIWTYYQGYKNFQVIPFNKLNDNLLYGYQSIYDQYKPIINQTNDERIQTGFFE